MLHTLRCRRRWWLVVTLALVAGLIGPVSATPAAAAPAPTPVARAALSFSGTAHTAHASDKPQVCDPDLGCGGGGGGGCGPFCPPPPGCDVYLDGQSASRGDNPELGGTYSHVGFQSRISCSGGPYAESVQAQLWDRTQGNDGYVLSAGSLITNTSGAASSGSVDLYDVDWYPYAQSVEQVLVVHATGGSGFVWTSCNTPPQGRFLWCNGLGTSTLDAAIGWMPFATGVSAARIGCSFFVNDILSIETEWVSGSGTVRCNQQANIQMRVTLSRWFNGGWQAVVVTVASYSSVPKDTTKLAAARIDCINLVDHATSDWKV